MKGGSDIRKVCKSSIISRRHKGQEVNKGEGENGNGFRAWLCKKRSGRDPTYPLLSLDPVVYALTTPISCFVVGQNFFLDHLPIFSCCHNSSQPSLKQLDPLDHEPCGLLPEFLNVFCESPYISFNLLIFRSGHSGTE
ncbi:hypothetical protein Tco_0805074 [Tanacetum coccineum]